MSLVREARAKIVRGVMGLGKEGSREAEPEAWV
jgi:hypothetical protein